MPPVRRAAALGSTVVVACLLAACSSGPTESQNNAVRTILTTTTTPPTTATTTPAPTTTVAGVAVPNVVGQKIAAAHASLRTAGFTSVNLNTPCNKGTLASQSVVASLALPGKPPDPRVGAVPLNPGTALTPGTRVGIVWSGCYADATATPAVVGLTFPAARAALHGAGLNWSCFTVAKPPATTTTKPPKTTTSTSDGTTTTTAPPTTTTTAKAAQTVLTQSPVAGTVLHPGATVTLTMHHCPQ
jgi:beta-lactam-binding protein with PASTA domain